MHIYRPYKTGKGFIKNDDPVEYAGVGDKVKDYKNLYDVQKHLSKSTYDKIYIYDDIGVVDVI